MNPLMTLPAESFSLPNGSPPKASAQTYSLGGNILWAVGRQPESRVRALFYFHGIKGGSQQWHKFPLPADTAAEVQLELRAEGGLGVRMDDRLFLGNVESVLDAQISWSEISETCQDFQLGRDRVCFRKKRSNSLSIAPCDPPFPPAPLPPPPLAPDCYCLSPHDDVIVLSGRSVLVLAPPYLHWARLQTAPAPRSILSALFSAKEPRFKRLSVSGKHFVALSQDGDTLSLLPLTPCPSWEHVALRTATTDLCPVGSPVHTLAFLLLDRHSSLSLASLEAGSLHTRELPHSLLPDRETILSCIRCLNFECPSQLSGLLSPSSSSSTPPFSSPSYPNNPNNPDNPDNPENPDNPDNPDNPENPDAFFTAAPPELQPMEVELSLRPIFSPAPLHNSFHPADPPADLSPIHLSPNSEQLESDPSLEFNDQLISTHSPELPNQLISTHSPELPNQLISTHSPELPNQLISTQSPELPNQLISTHSPELPNQLISIYSSEIPTHPSELPNHQISIHSSELSFDNLVPGLSADLSNWVVPASPPPASNPIYSLERSEQRISTPDNPSRSADPRLSQPADSMFSYSYESPSESRPPFRPESETAHASQNGFEKSRTGSKRAKSPPSQWPIKFHRSEPIDLDLTDPGPHMHSSYRGSLFAPSPAKKLAMPPTARTSGERRIDARLLRERVHPCPLPRTAFLPFVPDFSHFQYLVLEAEAKVQSQELLLATQIILSEEEFDFNASRGVFEELSAILPAQDEPFALPTAPPTATVSCESPTPSAPPTLTYDDSFDTSTHTHERFQL